MALFGISHQLWSLRRQVSLKLCLSYRQVANLTDRSSSGVDGHHVEGDVAAVLIANLNQGTRQSETLRAAFTPSAMRRFKTT